jgi:predicted phosphodiesterase
MAASIPRCPDQEVGGLVAAAQTNVICVGHTHWPLDRIAAGVRVLNVGSASNPWAADPRASYLVLDASEVGFGVEFRRLACDL